MPISGLCIYFQLAWHPKGQPQALLVFQYPNFITIIKCPDATPPKKKLQLVQKAYFLIHNFKLSSMRAGKFLIQLVT